MNIEVDKISGGQFVMLLSPNFDVSYTAVRDDFTLQSFIFCKYIKTFRVYGEKQRTSGAII